MASRPTSPNRFWWIHPGKLLLFFLAPIYTLIVFVVPQTSPHLLVLRAALYAQGWYALYGLLVLIAMGACALIGGQVEIDALQEGSSIRVNSRLLMVFGSITIMAYAIWFYPAVLRWNFHLSRDDLNRIPGVTSFSQLGVSFMCAYLGSSLLERADLGAVVRLQFKLLIFLTAARVYLWSERLALIEVAVPIAILVFTHRAPRSAIGKAFYQVVGAFGPFLAVPLMLVMFTVTEFFRSWTTYSHTQSQPLLDFMTARLTTYYFTAINNGACMLVTQPGRWPTYDFRNVQSWLYSLPVIGEELAPSTVVHDNFLARFADVEFNNLSGIFPIVWDLGWVLAFVYFCGLGFVAGVLYRSMLNGRILGVLFYPSFFVGCLEIMRITYLNGSRCTVIWVGNIVAYLSVRVARARYARTYTVAQRTH